MELVALIFYGGLFYLMWMVARFFGWLFKGPRYRRRQMRKYLRTDLRETERIYMRNVRRGHRW